MLVGVGAALTLARFSEDFLILRAKNAGLPIALAPLALVMMNLSIRSARFRIASTAS